MNKSLIFLIYLLLTIILLQDVSASYGFDAYVEGESQSFEMDSEYGSQPQVDLKVINNNGGLDYLCSLSCSYSINSNLEENFNSLDDQGNFDIQDYNLNLKERGKEGAKDLFDFKFSCDVSTSGICGGEIQDKSIKLIINYLLNPEQREAKAFIEGVLITLNENIKNADSKIQKVETKLESLSSNVKIGSIKQDTASIRSTHNSLKDEIENLDKIVKQDFDYILARNTYQISFPTEITSNGDKAENLEKELNKIIETHNKVSEEINTLGEKNSQVNSKLNLLNEINNIDSEVKLLIENFKSGNFDNYEEVGRNVDYYFSILDELLSTTTNKIEQIKLTGNSVLINENERLCDKYEFCLESKKLGTIEETCNYLKKLQDETLSENEKRVSEDKNKDFEDQNNEKGFLSRIINFFKNILGLISGNVIDMTPKEERIIELSNDYKEFIFNNCEFEIKDYSFEKLGEINTEVVDVTGQGIKETEESVGQCCIGEECTTCCVEESCRSNPSLYPIIFVHGHSATSWNSLDYSINAFKEFEDKLKKENYVSMGILLPDSNINNVEEESWGKIRKPISVRVSYYKGVYDENGREIGKEQDQAIDLYSQRLSDVVDIVLHHTGKDKVIVVSHSMGGLVSRNYIKNYGGEDKVYKLVTIGTPNHGVWNEDMSGLTGLCGLTHGGLQECQDMKFDSIFIQQLNENYESHPNVNTLAIVGVCEECNYGTYQNDEVVRVKSAKLSGAKNVEIKGHLVSGFGTFHQDLTKNEDVYNEVMRFINS